MAINVRRRIAALALGLSAIGAAGLTANVAFLSPTADGGLPGPVITRPTIKPTYTFKPTITRPPITIGPLELAPAGY